MAHASTCLRVRATAAAALLIHIWLALSHSEAQPVSADNPVSSGNVAPLSAAVSQDWRGAWQFEMSNVSALYNAGRYREAANAAEKALKIAETNGDLASPTAVTTLNALGELNRILLLYDKAEEFLLRAKNAYKDRPADYMDPLLDSVLTNIATLYFDLGRYPEAEKLLKRSIEYLATVPGSDLDSATRLNTLAAVLQRLGMFAEAEMTRRRRQCFGRRATRHPLLQALS
jgi:tetratricopeptide (TPR) repeat protein